MSARWHTVPIPLPGAGESETFVVGDLALLLCNAGGEAFVIDDTCPHALQSLRGGRIEGTVIECPLHGGSLDLRSGEAVSLPIRRPTHCYPVRQRGDGLEVSVSD